MPTVSLSLSSLLDIASLIPASLMDGHSGQDFLSLLNTSQAGGNATDHSSPKNDHPDQNAQAPVAALLDLPAPVVSNAPAQNANPPAASSAPTQQSPTSSHSDNNAPASSQSASQADNNDNRNASQNASQSSNNNTPANQSSSNTQSSSASSSTQSSGTQNTSQATVTNAADQSNSGNTSQDAQSLRDQLRGELAAIDQILLAIMQALSGNAAAAVTVQTAVTTSDTTVTTDASASISADGSASSSSLANLLLQWQVQLQQAADAQTNALLGTQGGNALPIGTTASDTTSTASLISDMQALIQQLQQELQPLSAQDQPVTAQPTQTLTLTQTWTQLLAQQATSAAPTQTITSPSLADLGSMLKNDIAQARNTLQQLQTVNQTLYNNAQSSLQAQLSPSSSDQPVKDALANLAGLLLAKDPTPVPAVTVDSSTNNDTGNTPAVQSAPALPPVVTMQFVAQPAVMLDVTQGGANSGGNGSGGNQDQGLPQMVMPTTSAPSQPAASAGATSFARLLDQASPGSLLDQVTFNIKTAIDDGSSKIHIQLDPADLGKLDIRLDVGADGKTGVVITADNKNTLSLLQQNAQGLTRALSDAGLSTDSGSLSFNLGGQNANSGQGQSAPQAAFTYQKSQPDDQVDSTAIGTVISRSYVVNLTQGLDITI